MAPLVLLLVLGTHVAARRSADLTPWKGGGFGMFSTVDSPAGRVVRVALDTDLGRLTVAVPPSLRDQAATARAAPSTGRLTELARAVGERWWVVPDVADLTVVAGPGAPPAADAVTRAIAAEAVRDVDPERFDPATQRRLAVGRVTVAVLRPDTAPGGAGTGTGSGLVVTPTPIRAVTVAVGAAPGTGESGR